MSSKGKKKVLGRGLNAILQSPETDITASDISGNYVAGAIAEIDINKIETNPFQPRSDFDEMMLREMSESILEQGVIQPISVRKLGYDKYQLIAGERRLRASKMAGLKSIPVFIRVANDEQMLELALIENIHRKNLNAIEVAISYQRLIDECKLTQEKLSDRVGKNRSTIANILRLLKLSPEVQVALRDEYISMGHARALVPITDQKLQARILKKIIKQDLNVRQVERLIRSLVKDSSIENQADENKREIPEKYKETPGLLSRRFGAKVSLKRSNKGKGSIVINFNDDSELDNIISIIGD